jgi:outer membrane protein
VANASAALKNVLGVEADAPVQPAGLAAPGQLPPLPAGIAAASLDESLQTAYADRPDLLRQQALVQSNLSALRAAQKRAGLSISADYVLDYQATNDVGTRGTNSQFLVTGSYPLFDAGSARGAIRIAQGQVDVSRNALLSTRQQVRLDVEQALSTRNESLAATRLAQAAVTAAQVNYDAAIESRRAGVGTVLDITTAQATLTQAQNQYVSAVYNFYIADAQLLRAVGRNDAGIRVP